MNKQIITASVCLLASLTIAGITGKNFMDVKKPDELRPGPGVTQTKMLSDYFPDIAGTNADSTVYVMEGEQPGGKMLVLGGTHANEPSGYLAAITFVESGKVEQGTVFVIPRTCNSGFTHNDPQEGSPQYYTIQTKGGQRQFRYGSRAANPLDQWPDPDVYVHAASGQRLSGSETRNINRTYPGRPDGTLTEKASYAIRQLIDNEGVNLTFDLHEASPEYPVINATVAHETAMSIASNGMFELQMAGIAMSLEPSPTNLHGLTHRELGDYTDTLPLLMETANASQGRLRGKTNADLVLTGKDKCYVKAQKLGFLYVPYDETGHPIEERVGRHLQGVYEYSKAYSAQYPDTPIVYSGLPSYQELFLDADPSELGGTRLGQYLN